MSAERALAGEAVDQLSPVRDAASAAVAPDKRGPDSTSLAPRRKEDAGPTRGPRVHPEEVERSNVSLPATIITAAATPEQARGDLILVVRHGALLPSASQFERSDSHRVDTAEIYAPLSASHMTEVHEERRRPEESEGELLLVVKHGVLLSAADGTCPRRLFQLASENDQRGSRAWLLDWGG